MGFALSIFHAATDVGKQGLYKKTNFLIIIFLCGLFFWGRLFSYSPFLLTFHQLMLENKFNLLGISYLFWIFWFEMQYWRRFIGVRGTL